MLCSIQSPHFWLFSTSICFSFWLCGTSLLISIAIGLYLLDFLENSQTLSLQPFQILIPSQILCLQPLQPFQILIPSLLNWVYGAISSPNRFVTANKGAVMESETATAAAFSFLGADRVIIRPGSEMFVPGLSSLTDLQSVQMLDSHSNQMDLHKFSVIPIHPAQFGREIYDMGSTQYSNMPLSANLNAPGANNGVPTNRSVPVSVDKSCPTQDSLHYHGGNGEAISHSRSSSASDEADEQLVIDERKQRRMLSNRESARRSRLRKQQHLDELMVEVDHLRAENGQIIKKFKITSQLYAHITQENCLMRSEALELSGKLQRLHHTLSAQSRSFLKTVGTETRNCSAAHMSSESGTIAQLVSPDLWF